MAGRRFPKGTQVCKGIDPVILNRIAEAQLLNYSGATTQDWEPIVPIIRTTLGEQIMFDEVQRDSLGQIVTVRGHALALPPRPS